MTLDKPILAGVVGWPVEHSLSPLIHTIWATRAGINGYYVPIAIPPNYDEFAQSMDSLKRLGFKGLNVTLPHKQHALRYADVVSERAEQSGAANMLTFGDAGAVAENSDIEGFSCALNEHATQTSSARAAMILGAGGAARGVAVALKDSGVSDLRIANRTREKAEAIASEFDLTVIDWDARNDRLPDLDLLVNTTSLGMAGQPPLDIKTEILKPDAIVADIVYTPLETPLLNAARVRGCITSDGLSMLMHQAVSGFRAWFGGAALVDDELRDALVNELARRETR